MRFNWRPLTHSPSSRPQAGGSGREPQPRVPSPGRQLPGQSSLCAHVLLALYSSLCLWFLSDSPPATLPPSHPFSSPPSSRVPRGESPKTPPRDGAVTSPAGFPERAGGRLSPGCAQAAPRLSPGIPSPAAGGAAELPAAHPPEALPRRFGRQRRAPRGRTEPGQPQLGAGAGAVGREGAKGQKRSGRVPTRLRWRRLPQARTDRAGTARPTGGGSARHGSAQPSSPPTPPPAGPARAASGGGRLLAGRNRAPGTCPPGVSHLGPELRGPGKGNNSPRGSPPAQGFVLLPPMDS